MKKIISFLVLFVISIIPASVSAFELRCNKNTYQYGEQIYCGLFGDMGTYDKLEGVITSSDPISCSSTDVDTGLLTGNITENNYFSLTGTPSNSNLLTFTCNITRNVESSTNTQISITNFLYHKASDSASEQSEIIKSDYIKIEPYLVSQEVDTKPRDTTNADTRLKSLNIPELDFTFSQFITEYNIEVLYEVESISLNYLLNDELSSVYIDGDTNLKVGKNIIDIYVTSEDGLRTNCYTINILRLARGVEIYYEEKDASLSSLTITGYAIKFEKNIFEYNLHLTSDIDEVKINPITTYSGATYSITQPEKLVNGSTIKILVSSADDSTKQEYLIHITKDAPKKDYSVLIIISVLAFAFVGTITIFILTSQKKKIENPLLKFKKNKKNNNVIQPENQNVVVNQTQEVTNNNVTEPVNSEVPPANQENINIVQTQPLENYSNITPENINKALTEVQTNVNPTTQDQINNENVSTNNTNNNQLNQ